MRERFSPGPDAVTKPKEESRTDRFVGEIKKKLAEYTESRQAFWKGQDFISLLNSKDTSLPHRYQKEKNSGQKRVRLRLKGEGALQRLKSEYLKERVEYEATTKPRLTSSEIIEGDNHSVNITRSFTREQVSSDERLRGDVDLALEFDNGFEKRNIADYLPPGWKIIEMQNEDGTGQADLSKNQIQISRFIRIPIGQRGIRGTHDASFVRNDIEDGKEYEVHELLKAKGFLLTILHEAGHACNSLGMSNEELHEENRLRALSTPHPMFGFQDASALKDPDFQQKYTENVIQEERDAWYYALRVFRELEQEDFTITDMTNREIIHYIQEMLGSYENCFKFGSSNVTTQG